MDASTRGPPGPLDTGSSSGPCSPRELLRGCHTVSLDSPGQRRKTGRHESLQKTESPPIRLSPASGQYGCLTEPLGKPLDPDTIAQDIEDTMNTALNELRELELQSSSKPAPDVVLDTLEQIRNAPPPASLPPHSPLRSLLLRPSEAASLYRGPGSSSDSLATFRPAVAPRMGVQLRPPILRPKPLVLPRPGTSQPTAPTLQGPLDKTCTM